MFRAVSKATELFISLLLSSAELGRKGEWFWPRRVLPRSANDGKNLRLLALWSYDYLCFKKCILPHDTNILFCFTTTMPPIGGWAEVPSKCHNIALWILRRAWPWGQSREKGKLQDTYAIKSKIFGMLCSWLNIFWCFSLFSRPVVIHCTIFTLSSLTRYSQRKIVHKSEGVFSFSLAHV